MLFKEIIAVYTENDTKTINKNAELIIIKPSSTGLKSVNE